MNFINNFERYHFIYMYDTCCCPQFNKKFFKYWKLYQIRINEKINSLKEYDNINDLMTYDDVIENMTTFMLKKSIEFEKFMDLCKNFANYSFYSNIFYSNNYILKKYNFHIVNFPFTYDKDLLNSIDVHNEGFIQYILSLYTPKKICKKCIPNISYVLYAIDDNKKILNTGIYMEKINGEQFSSILIKNDNKRIIKILIKLLDIIKYYQYRFNFLHNDLKPDNILIDNQDNIYLIDFGLSYINFMNNHIFTTCLDGLEIDKKLNENKDYNFDFYSFLNFEFKYNSDILYLFLNMLYKMNPANELYQWILNGYLIYNDINIHEYVKKSNLNYFEFILSKDKKIFEYHFPSLNYEIFYSKFDILNVKFELEKLLYKIEEKELNQNLKINNIDNNQYFQNNLINSNNRLNIRNILQKQNNINISNTSNKSNTSNISNMSNIQNTSNISNTINIKNISNYQDNKNEEISIFNTFFSKNDIDSINTFFGII